MTTNIKKDSMITSIVFSKNRPLQLDLCLESIHKNFPACNKIIVLHNNDAEFTESHSILCSEHNDIQSWAQSCSLFQDISDAITTSDNDYICFFTDDDICFKEVPNTEYDKIFVDQNIQCLSLRMGLNITQRNHEDMTFPDLPHQIYDYDDAIIWSKTAHLYGSYWSYSLSVDGHIFRKNEILQMIDELCILDSRYKWKQTPNALEAALQRFWTISPNTMASFQYSVVVNSPNNRVQDSHQDNRSGDFFDYDSKFLLDKYMSGYRINLSRLDFSHIQCPHTEIDLMKGIECYTT